MSISSVLSATIFFNRAFSRSSSLRLMPYPSGRLGGTLWDTFCAVVRPGDGVELGQRRGDHVGLVDGACTCLVAAFERVDCLARDSLVIGANADGPGTTRTQHAHIG
jgi:hypothetical protein